MSSDFTGTPGAVFLTVPMLDDGDRPSAQLWRQTLEPIVDSLADLDTRTGGVEGEAILASGGLYTLGGLLTINTNSFAWRFDNGETTFLGGSACVFESASSLHLESGADLVVESGGEISVSSGGDINLASGADLTAASGAGVTLASGSTLTQVDGATVTLNGTVSMTASSELNLASGADIVGAAGAEIAVASADDIVITSPGTAYTARHTLVPVQMTAGAFEPATGVNGIWVDAVADGASVIVFGIKALPGDIISNIKVRVTGQVGVSGHAAVPATPLRVIATALDVDGAATSLDAVNDPSGSAGAFNAPHDITLSSGSFPYTMTGDTLIVTVRSEGGAGAEVDKTAILSIRVNGIALKFRNVLEFC